MGHATPVLLTAWQPLQTAIGACLRITLRIQRRLHALRPEAAVQIGRRQHAVRSDEQRHEKVGQEVCHLHAAVTLSPLTSLIKQVIHHASTSLINSMSPLPHM